jgi:polyisoprenoid-binding protein YceI
MKKFLGAAFVAGAMSITGAASAQEGADQLTAPMDLLIQHEHSQIVLSWSHNGFSTTTAVLRDFEGTVHLDPTNIENSHVEVTIQMNSLDSFYPTRDVVLMGPRFLDVFPNPVATFVSKSVKRTGDFTADIEGDLTLMKQTFPVTLAAKFNKAGNSMNTFIVGFDATTEIKRADVNLADIPNTGPTISVNITAELVKP